MHLNRLNFEIHDKKKSNKFELWLKIEILLD